jgi:hypothetical protein
MKMLLISQVAVLAKEIEKDSAAMDTTISAVSGIWLEEKTFVV